MVLGIVRNINVSHWRWNIPIPQVIVLFSVFKILCNEPRSLFLNSLYKVFRFYFIFFPKKVLLILHRMLLQGTEWLCFVLKRLLFV